MAHAGCSKQSAEPKSSDTSEYDPALDFYSEKFDPLKALQSANIKIPVPNAPIYDNIAKYETVVMRGLSTEQRTKEKQEKAASLKFERKFLPEQMPIKTERKPRKRKNVVTQMEKFKGPLAVLKTCVDKHIQIKVWTRHSHNIRGYCLAFCVAFDKHWNMALEDVTEVWSRKRAKKVPALDSRDISTIPSQSRRKVIPPKVVITKKTKTLEFCERHVPQLIVRGEQVAFIHIIK